MAAKRISKTAINWASLAERVPEAQRASYQAFKTKSDGYLRRVLSYPEQPPTIDWSFYRSKIPLPGLVDEFEKSFNSLKIPYPADTQTTQIDALQTQSAKKTEEYIAISKEKASKHQIELDRLNAIMPLEEMTMEDFRDAFPDDSWDYKKPTMWPHDEPNPEKMIEPLKSHH